MTTHQAAKQCGCTPRNIQQAIKNGRLPAKKVGRDYNIRSSDLELWQLTRRPGRPKGT